jgi:hypothetical protein
MAGGENAGALRRTVPWGMMGHMCAVRRYNPGCETRSGRRCDEGDAAEARARKAVRLGRVRRERRRDAVGREPAGGPGVNFTGVANADVAGPVARACDRSLTPRSEHDGMAGWSWNGRRWETGQDMTSEVRVTSDGGMSRQWRRSRQCLFSLS